MASIRAVAAETAKLLGRAESEGWVFTRYFQDRRLFAVGRGGRYGAGAPPAEAWHGILLALAMGNNLPVKEAVAEAAAIYTLPFSHVVSATYRDGFHLGSEPLSVDPAAVRPFGEVLAAPIVAYQAGQLSAEELAGYAVEFGFERLPIGVYCAVGRLYLPFRDKEDGSGLSRVSFTFAHDITDPAALGHATRRMVEFGGGLLLGIANALGPIAGAGGGGDGLDRGEDEDGNDVEDEAPLAASSADGVARDGEEARH